MVVSTAHFGDIDLQPEDVLELEGGLVPFADLTRYVLLSVDEEEPFRWLQSVDVAALAFILLPLESCWTGFGPRLGPGRDWLRLAPGEEPLWLVTVVLADRPEELRANLLAPIALNLAARRGKQVVQDLPVEWARTPIAALSLLQAAA